MALAQSQFDPPSERFPLLIDIERSLAALAEGALLVDIRSGVGRKLIGYFEIGIAVEKDDLLTVFSPSSRKRRKDLPQEQPILFFCGSDVTAMRFVELLRRVGVHNACNVAGGYEALRQAGLPVAPQD